MIKTLLLSLAIIASLEFNLQWNGNEHVPNVVKVQDQQGIEVDVVDNWEKKDGITYWNVYNRDGSLLTFLNFWSY